MLTDHYFSAIRLGGVLFAVTLFASPLLALKDILRNKLTKAIPLPFTIALFVNSDL